MPYRTPHAALEFRWALACLLPTLLRIRHEVSRVPYGGLKQDDVGGALSTVPSALCGSPDGAWGKSRFTHALFHRAYGITQCRASCCRHDSFSWSGWHHRQGMPGSSFPEGRYALQVDSPCRLSVKHTLLATCLRLSVPFRGMLLTP
jgi:hypothetical protein